MSYINQVKSFFILIVGLSIIEVYTIYSLINPTLSRIENINVTYNKRNCCDKYKATYTFDIILKNKSVPYSYTVQVDGINSKVQDEWLNRILEEKVIDYYYFEKCALVTIVTAILVILIIVAIINYDDHDHINAIAELLDYPKPVIQRYNHYIHNVFNPYNNFRYYDTVNFFEWLKKYRH